jgi:hypothetical protein
MMVLLVGGTRGELCLREELVHTLARLGVTDVAVVRDDRTVGIVLEGWLFDPARDADVVAEAIGAATRPRALHPVMHLAVSAASHAQRS